MKMRLQKLLSSRGVASRRQAESIIEAGRVTCNGRICAVGDSADPDCDEILLDGEPLPEKSQYVYIMLNKPKGFVTTLHDEKGRRNAAELVADCKVRVYPVGRLDMDSEGLLIFTNDGDFANMLMHPKHEVDKTYRVWVQGYTYENFEKLKQPIVLDGYQIKKPDVQCLRIADADNNTAVMQIVIHEGRNRQVRRMCAAAGMKVTKLLRVAEGRLCLGDLKSGSWRYLTEQEVRMLKN